LLLREREEPGRFEQHVQCGEDRPAGDLGHRPHREGQVAGVFAARSVYQPDVSAVKQQPGCHPRFSQQALETCLAAGLPMVSIPLDGLVDVKAGRNGLNQHQPGVGTVLWLDFLDRPGWPQRLVVIRQGDFEVGKRSLLARPADQIACLPAENVVDEAGEVGNGWHGIVAIDFHFLDPFKEPAMFGNDVSVDMGPGRVQRRRRHDEADRLQVAEPFLVGQKVGIAGHSWVCCVCIGSRRNAIH
jgi:hypothetical protein